MPDPRWEIPFDKYGKLNPLMRARGLALNSRTQEITQSSHFTLNALTTLLQVTAISKDMFLKWADDGEDYATAQDFDEFIPAGTTVELMIPLKTDGDFYEDIQIVGREASGSVSIVEK
jgi:hypothetical protein